MLSRTEKFQKDTDDFYFSKTKDEIFELLQKCGFEIKDDDSIFDRGINVTHQFEKYLK